MPRKERVEYGGALYHVMGRGNRLEAIFCDDRDHEVFLKTLGEASERCGWRVHCYVLLLEISAVDLPKQPKGSAEKIALASVARQRTSVTNAWLAKRLSMGAASRVSRYCGEAAGRSAIQKLAKRIKMAIGENPFPFPMHVAISKSRFLSSPLRKNHPDRQPAHRAFLHRDLSNTSADGAFDKRKVARFRNGSQRDKSFPQNAKKKEVPGG